MSGSAGRVLAVGAVAVAVVAVVAQAVAPGGSAPVPTIVPVVTTEVVCPDGWSVADGSRTTQLSAVTPRPLVGAGVGRAVVGTTRSAASLATLSGTRYGVVRSAPPGTGAMVGSAVGARAPGFAMDQLTVSEGRVDHGLAGTSCSEPETDVWFVGTGSGVGHQAELFLTNTEATPASVDVALYGKNGRVNAPNGLGLVVRGNTRRFVSLDRLAPGAGALAVRVTATSGRVASAVRDSEVNGLVPRGADWAPAAAAPARQVVVPGLGSGEGARVLSVFAPGEGTATVRVRLVGEQGSFAPTGAASFDLDRGSVATVDLGAAIASDETAVVVDADVPVVAGVRWSVRSGSVDELALSAGATPISAPAVVAGNRVTGGYTTALMLTAPGAAAAVSVQPLLNGVAAGKPVTIKVGAGRTVRRQMPSGGAPGSFQVVITPVPGSAPVFGAVLRRRAVDGATGTTVSLVRNARTTVGVPAAWPNLDVGLGR